MGAHDQHPSGLGTRHRLTSADVQAMVRAGVLDGDARVELIDGELFDMAPIGHPHGHFVQQMAIWLVRATDISLVRVQQPLTLSADDTVQPDLCVLASAEGDTLADGPAVSSVQLVVEVSDTTLAYELKKKLPKYAAAGVPELWVLDLPKKRLLLHREPENARYALVRELYAPAHVKALLVPGFELELGTLFI